MVWVVGPHDEILAFLGLLRANGCRTAKTTTENHSSTPLQNPLTRVTGEARDVSSRDLGELSSESRCRWVILVDAALTATSVEIGTSLRSLIW